MSITIAPGEQIPDVIHLDAAIPLGTSTSYSQGARRGEFEHNAPMTWLHSSRLIDRSYLYNPHYLYGDTEIVLPDETEDMFRWRIRDTAMAFAERSGVDRHAVDRLASSFGATGPLIYEGGIITSNFDIEKLPAGTVIYSGHPDYYQGMNVWEVGEHGVLKGIYGAYAAGHPEGMPVTIHSLPAGTEQWTPGEPATAKQLANIAARAWRLGKRAKTSHGWCGTFEHAVTCLNLEKVSQGAGTGENIFVPGDEVSRVEAANLPEGSMLFWRYRNRQAMSVYVRDDSATNQSKTRRVWGYYDNQENSHERMTVARIPGDEVGYTWLIDGVLMQQMPNGVVYRRYGYTTTYTVGDPEVSRPYVYDTYEIMEFPV